MVVDALLRAYRDGNHVITLCVHYLDPPMDANPFAALSALAQGRHVGFRLMHVSYGL